MQKRLIKPTTTGISPMSVQTKLETDAVLAAKTTTKIPKTINPAEIRNEKTLSIFDLAMRSQRLARPEPNARRKAQGLSKVFDRGRSKILEAQQRSVGCFTDFADCLQAFGCQRVP